MNEKDLSDVMTAIGALAALRGDLQYSQNAAELFSAREPMLAQLKCAEDAIERVALGIHRKGATIQ